MLTLLPEKKSRIFYRFKSLVLQSLTNLYRWGPWRIQLWLQKNLGRKVQKRRELEQRKCPERKWRMPWIGKADNDRSSNHLKWKDFYWFSMHYDACVPRKFPRGKEIEHSINIHWKSEGRKCVCSWRSNIEGPWIVRQIPCKVEYWKGFSPLDKAQVQFWSTANNLLLF